MTEWLGSNIQQTRVPRKMIGFMRSRHWELERITDPDQPYRSVEVLVKEGFNFRYLVE